MTIYSFTACIGTSVAATNADKLDIDVAGASFTGLTFTKDGNDLQVTLASEGTVTVTDYFSTAEDGRLKNFIVGGNEYTLGWHESNSVDYEGMYLEQTFLGNTTAVLGIPNWINSGTGDDSIVGANNHDMLAGNSGNNTITAVAGAEVYAENGNDTVTAAGNNFIGVNGVSGEGKDIINLEGTGNNTIWVYNDTPEAATAKFNMVITGATSTDTLKFNKGAISGCSLTDLSFAKNGNDLVITLPNDKGVVTVKDYFTTAEESRIKTFMTLENGVKTTSTLGWHESNAVDYEGMYLEQSENTNITAVTGIPNWINSGEGNDTITGANAHDMLAGNKGDNEITAAVGAEVYAENGNDIVHAAGNNFIWTHGGSDSIKLNGTGGNTVAFYDAEGGIINATVMGATSTDKLKFNIGTAGHGFSDMSFEKAANEADLLIKLGANGADGTITVAGYFTAAEADRVKTVIVGGNEYTIGWHKSNVLKDGDVAHEGMYLEQTPGGDATAVAGIPNWINTGEGNDKITGANKYDMLAGNTGNDSITASDNMSELFGDDGNDTLIGGAGDDYLWGGKGNNTLTGGSGSDTFDFTVKEDFAGQVHDTITDAASVDKIAIFGAKLTELTFTKSETDANDLVVTTKTNDTLTIKGYFTQTEENRVKTFQVDGVEYTLGWHESNAVDYEGMYLEQTHLGDTNALLGIPNWINSGTGDDKVVGANEHDMLAGNSGDNVITAAVGAEVYAENGNDVVNAAGNNFIWTHGGNDQIRLGETGNNTVAFYDDLAETPHIGAVVVGATSTDKLKFNIGLNGYHFADLSFTKDSNDLVISLKNGVDGKVTVADYFTAAEADRVKSFQTLDGTYNLGWHESNAVDFEGMYLEQSENTYITAVTGIPNWINSGAGNDSIYGANEHDMLAGNTGNNEIMAAAGAEVYAENGDDFVNAAGNNFIWTHGGNDTIFVNGGNNTIAIYDENPDTVINTKVVEAASTDTLKFTIGTNGYSFNDLVFTKDANNLVVTSGNDTITLDTFFNFDNRIDVLKTTDGQKSILQDAVVNVNLTDGGAHEATQYKEVINAEGNVTVTPNKTSEKTLISGNVEAVTKEGENIILTVKAGEKTANITLPDYVKDGYDNVYVNVSGEEKNLTEWLKDPGSGQVFDVGYPNATTPQTITDTYLNERLHGGKANDTITSTLGNDTLIGGPGNDVLNGSPNGDKTFQFSQKDGLDTIQNYKPTDTIKFTDVNNGTNMVYRRKGNDLQVQYNGTMNKFTLKNYLVTPKANNIKTVEFANGSKINLQSKYVLYTGKGKITDTIYNDKITGSKKNDKYVIKKGGNDIVNDKKGNDKYSAKVLDKLTINDKAGKDNYVISGTGITKITDKKGDDKYTIKSTGSTFIKDKKGSDNYIVNFSTDKAVEISDRYGDDTLTLSNIKKKAVQLFLNISAKGTMKNGDLIISGKKNGEYGFVKVDNYYKITRAGKQEVLSNNEIGAIETIQASNGELSYKIPKQIVVKEIKAAVASWLTNNNYADTAEVFEGGDNTDIKAFIAVYNNAK